MSVDLSPELEDLINRKLQTGDFASANDVVREALRLMDERDRLYEREKDEVRAAIAVGMISLRAGRSKDGEEVFARMEAELNALSAKG